MNELIETLKLEVKVYRSLLDVVRKEKEILISTDLDDLNENNRTKESLLIRLKSLESQRINLATSVCKSLGIDSEDPRLLEIAKYVNEGDADNLRNLHSVLELLLKRVHELNQQNEKLVQSALTSITGALKAIKNTLDENPTYKKKGKGGIEGVTPSGQLVSREA